MPKKSDTIPLISSPPRHHPVTGCRVDTLFGLWLCPKPQLDELVDAAWSIVQTPDGLKTLISSREDEGSNSLESKGYLVKDGLAEVTISGPITKYPTSFQSLFGGASSMVLRDVFREIRADPSVKGVLLHADSPGGSVEGTSELVNAIKKTNETKPVFVHAEDKSTSAMLWASVVGRRFTAGPAALVGSMGAVMVLYDVSKQAEASNIKPIVVATGEFKGIGAKGVPISEHAQAEFQRQVDQIVQPFYKAVSSGRNIDLNKDEKTWEELKTARIFIGEDAVRVKLIDAVCSTDEAREYALKQIEGVSGRSSISVSMAGQERRTTMVTEQELAQIKASTGLQDLTADNAVAKACEFMASQAKTIQETPKAPEPMPAKLAVKYAASFAKDVDHLVKDGKMVAAQATVIKSAVLDDSGKLIAGAVDSEGNIVLSGDLVLKAFDGEKPNDLNKDLTKAQPVGRAVPGEAEKPKAEDVSADRIKSLQQTYGITEEEAKKMNSNSTN